MGLDHSDHIFGTILDVYAAAGSTRTNDFIDNSRPCDHNRKLCGSSHITPKFATIGAVTRIEIFTGNEGGQWRHKGDKDVSFGDRRQ